MPTPLGPSAPRPARIASPRGARAAVLCAAAGLLFARGAGANGRFPSADQIAFHPTDPQVLLVRTTFGLLVTRDGGQNFDWICEEAAGFSGEEDPPVAILGDGTLVAAPLEGLSLSRDAGCSFAFADLMLAPQQQVIDVSVDREDPSHAVAVTWLLGAQGSLVDIYETTDGGKSFGHAGQLPGTDLVPTTIDRAPSMPSRVVVTGSYSGPGGFSGAVERSDDGGKSFARYPLPLGGDSGVFLSAIDPHNSDRLYLRTRGVSRDRLLVSDDGGKTSKEVAQVSGQMLGFALSPDGSQVAIGGPSAGAQIASTKDLAFAPVQTGPVRCLGWSSAGLFACGDASAGVSPLLRSTDGGASFAPLLASLAAVRGPLATCPAQSPYAQTCPSKWPAIQSKLPGAGQGGAGGSASGAGGGAGAGVSGAGSGAAGAGGGASGGGAAGSGGVGVAAGSGAAGAAAPPPSAQASGGSGCGVGRAAGREEGLPAWLWAALGLGLLGRGRALSCGAGRAPWRSGR